MLLESYFEGLRESKLQESETGYGKMSLRTFSTWEMRWLRADKKVASIYFLKS